MVVNDCCNTFEEIDAALTLQELPHPADCRVQELWVLVELLGDAEFHLFTDFQEDRPCTEKLVAIDSCSLAECMNGFSGDESFLEGLLISLLNIPHIYHFGMGADTPEDVMYLLVHIAREVGLIEVFSPQCSRESLLHLHVEDLQSDLAHLLYLKLLGLDALLHLRRCAGNFLHFIVIFIMLDEANLCLRLQCLGVGNLDSEVLGVLQLHNTPIRQALLLLVAGIIFEGFQIIQIVE